MATILRGEDNVDSSVIVETNGLAVTDNAVVRYDGTTGKVQNSGVVIDDSGNAGIGTTPSAWRTQQKAIEIGLAALSNFSGLENTTLSTNMYVSSLNQFLYKNNGYASYYSQSNSIHEWCTAPSGTAGNVIPLTTVMTLDATGNLLLQSGTGALGYGTGAGGVVTQLTSKSTAVTFNKPSGRITMHNGALAAGATVSFVLYNTTMGPSDTLTLSIPNLIGNDIFYYKVTHNLYNGGAIIFVTNASGSSLSEAISINFNVHKGAIS